MYILRLNLDSSMLCADHFSLMKDIANSSQFIFPFHFAVIVLSPVYTPDDDS